MNGTTKHNARRTKETMLEVGNVFSYADDIRSYVVFRVTAQHIKRGVQAGAPGLYGFRCLWYGSNPYDMKHYARVVPIKEGALLVRPDIKGLTVDQLTLTRP